MPETINGIPLHPLMVHAAVVFIPLTLLGVLIIAVKASWRRVLGWWVLLLSFATVGFTLVAKETGEHLAEVIGVPEQHAELGDTLPFFTAVVFGFLAVLMVVDTWSRRRWAKRAAALEVVSERGDAGAYRAPLVVIILIVVTVLAALAAVGQAIRVGESGAKSVWAGVLDQAPAAGASPTATPSPSASGTASSSPSASATGSASGAASPSTSGSAATYTMAQVALHSSSGDCWTVVNGLVYNVTAWESQHPGGAARIIGMCGIDATSAYADQHAGQQRPANELAGFEIGTLAK